MYSHFIAHIQLLLLFLFEYEWIQAAPQIYSKRNVRMQQQQKNEKENAIRAKLWMKNGVGKPEKNRNLRKHLCRMNEWLVDGTDIWALSCLIEIICIYL